MALQALRMRNLTTEGTEAQSTQRNRDDGSRSFSRCSLCLCGLRVFLRWQTRLRRNQPPADGVARELGDAEEIELFHHLPAVRFNGLHAQVQITRDLLGRAALGNQL